MKNVEWTKDYHDSQVWLYAKVTDDLSLELSSWGNIAGGGRHSELKQWSIVLKQDYTGIVSWHTGKDVSDDKAKELALVYTTNWLYSQLTQVISSEELLNYLQNKQEKYEDTSF